MIPTRPLTESPKLLSPFVTVGEREIQDGEKGEKRERRKKNPQERG